MRLRSLLEARQKARGARPKTRASTASSREKYKKKEDDSNSDEDDTDKEKESKDHKFGGEVKNVKLDSDKLKGKSPSPASATGPRFARKEMLLEKL